MSLLNNTKRKLSYGNSEVEYYSLPALKEAGIADVSRLPVSIRMILESVLRHCDGKRITEANVKALANWKPTAVRTEEIPFVVARIILQDFTGVPLLVDLAAMRTAVAELGKDPRMIEPLVPVDLIVDHSVQTDFSGTSTALEQNLDMEFKRNAERYQLLKWGTQAFETFRVIPPSTGIIHQVNLEHLAGGVQVRDGIVFPDSLVGTDSHTTMINGLGIAGWGVGGIEAEAGMLGQPLYFLTPDVVGVHLTGSLRPGVTATDAALTLTHLLRETKVVGKFVEYFGEGAAALAVPERAVIANMSPEYGATMGFFPVDEECVKFLRLTGRPEEMIRLYEAYYKAQGMFGIPRKGQVDYSKVVELDLSTVEPCIAGPKRPQDQVKLPEQKQKFAAAFPQQKPATEITLANDKKVRIGNGSILIASITSCTNTSNPTLLLAAGLLARKAVQLGMKVPAYVKTSLAPGSRVVSEYLSRTGLQNYLDQLGFNTVGYGCMTCIGNSGPLNPEIETVVKAQDYVCAAVLSGNRNFEARVHPSIKANYLMSPPLVVAFALAGRVDIDITTETIGIDKDGKPVYLKDLWPSSEEINALFKEALKPEVFKATYTGYATRNAKWNEVPAPTGKVFAWDPKSTYIQNPPFFKGSGAPDTFPLEPAPTRNIREARALAIFGDSVTTDHISPAGAFAPTTPAGRYLIENGVKQSEFNSYGSRRGNDRVMTRGTFANVRIKNLMVPGVEGGVTRYQPSGEQMSIYDAAQKYATEGKALIVVAGLEYGTGSSRDWAAKGTALLGVKAVLARSFERIHRSNLVGMGILPLQFKEGVFAQTLGLDGTETYDILGLDSELRPQQDITVRVTRKDGTAQEIQVTCRIDTPIEVEYYRHGGILPYVLRQLIQKH